MRLNKTDREEFRRRVNLLYRSSCCLVLDDYKYFTYDGSNIQGNDTYYTNDKSKCPDSVCFTGKDKYPDKVRFWVAISNRGISKPLFRPSKSEAVNSNIYINECLEQRLLLFIREHIFWHDLAGCHYSKQTIAWIYENVNFVPKELVHQMSPRHARLRIFRAVWYKKSTREGGRLKRCSS